MKVKVEASGSPSGTRVMTEDGADISEQVRAVSFRHAAGGVPIVELDLSFVETVMQGKAAMIGPNGKQVRRIEYADGTVDEFEVD